MNRASIQKDAATVALILFLQSPALAFRLSGTDGSENAPHLWPRTALGDHLFAHWDLRELPNCTLPWSQGAGTPDIAGTAEFAPVGAAVGTWNAVGPALIGMGAVGGAGVAGTSDAFNVIDWGGGLPPGVLAVTYVWSHVPSGRIQEADIRFNDVDYIWQNAGGHALAMKGKPDIQTVAMHELGHVLGLGHASVSGLFNSPGAVMNPYLFLNDDIWIVGAGAQNCGASVGDSVDVILPGPDGVFDTPLNNCGAGDDVIESGVIKSGGNGLVDTDVDLAVDLSNRLLDPDDRAGVNFLYSPDAGDAPDPWLTTRGEYPTYLHESFEGRQLNGGTLDAAGVGGMHIFGIRDRDLGRNYTYEWLGKAPGKSDDVDGECEAEPDDQDEFDDGISYYPKPALAVGPLTVTGWIRHASDNEGNAHAYRGANGRPLWWNAWIDHDQDGKWEEGAEHIAHASRSPVNPNDPNTAVRTSVSATTNLTGGFNQPHRPLWLRARLDWGEDSGASANLDGSLDLPRGAAQFGEVEDYPIPLARFAVYNQNWIWVPNGVPAAGARVVYSGQLESPGFFWADVDDNDCVLELFDPNLVTMSYDAQANETTVDYIDPAHPMQPGRRRHVGKCQGMTLSAPPAQKRGEIVPPTGPRSSSENWIPASNTQVFTYEDGLARIVIGAVDEGSGGHLGGRDSTGTWADSIEVVAYYRVSPVKVPLENLSPCDPMVASLPRLLAGSAYITPEKSFEFVLDHLQFDPDTEWLIVETELSWGTNQIRAEEYTEFLTVPENPLDVPVDPVPPSSLRLVVSPNPTATNALLRYSLPTASRVACAIHDVSGAIVRRVDENRVMSAGEHQAVWDGRDASGHPVGSGVYYLRMSAGQQEITRRILVTR